MEDTIVSLRFTDADRALRALYEFRQLDRDRRLKVRGAVLVQRSPEGPVDGPQPDPHGDGQHLPPGGIVGMLLDVLRGPLGVLFARPTDGFRGGGGHPAHEAEREIALDQIGRSLEAGVTLVVAEIADPEPGALDSALRPLGGDVTRRPAREVYAEVWRADEAEKAKMP
jgi:hypothetical protein